jgi:hypothetical protein
MNGGDWGNMARKSACAPVPLDWDLFRILQKGTKGTKKEFDEFFGSLEFSTPASGNP